MKKLYYPWFIALTGVLLSLSACDKSSQTPVETNNYEDQITALVDQSSEQMEKQEVMTDEATGDVFILNEGIIPNYLVDDSYTGDDPNNQDPSKLLIRDKSIIKCLRGLNLADTQQVKVKRVLNAYFDCKERAVNRVKEIYHELRVKYKNQYNRLLMALQNGSITRQEFKAAVEKLKEDFRAELKRRHLQEKLDTALRECFHKFLRNLHGILSETQWNAFYECCKGL